MSAHTTTTKPVHQDSEKNVRNGRLAVHMQKSPVPPDLLGQETDAQIAARFDRLNELQEKAARSYEEASRDRQAVLDEVVALRVATRKSGHMQRLLEAADMSRNHVNRLVAQVHPDFKVRGD